MIKLFKGYQYDNNYDYTKMFSSKANQTAYFNSLDYDVIDNTNYIRVNNTFNVELSYDYMDSEGINYIIFNNGFRDIYGFIIQKEYLKEELTRIVYEVDVLQTYMFDFNLNESFVERKVCTDMSQLVDFDEGLNLGMHTIVSETTAFTKTATYFIMLNGIKNFEVSVDTNGEITNYSEIPTNLDIPLTNINGINYPLFFIPADVNTLLSLSNHPSVVGVVRFPHCSYTTQQIMIPSLVRTVNESGKSSYTTIQIVVNACDTITAIDDSGSGGSVSKTEVTDFFPYTYYVLTDGEGEPLIMKPQELPSSISVIGKYALSHTPTERFFVQNFKGDTFGRAYNITNNNQMMLPTATSDGMSYISANGGMLKMQSQNGGVETALNMVGVGASAVATGGMSLAFGGGLGTIASGVNKLREADQRTKDMLLTPSSISSYGTPSSRLAFGTNNVRVLKYSVSETVKNKIRGFITRFGNKFNNFDTIDLTTYKGYLKMVSPDIDSKIDNVYIDKIREILERGVYIE